MTTARRRLLLVTLAVSLLLAIGPGPVAAAPVGTATATASSSVWPPDPARPFSDPVWLPLRDPARVSCTYRNCTDSGGAYYHGYWAVDFLGERGDPIHPAGAGVLHVGAVDGSCRTGTTESSGTWVWIDHGGGVVTKYNHLDSVTPGLDGQLVTPETQIGTMGHSGDHAPCVTDYLHFEVRTGGVTGPRVDPGRLWGCRGTSRVAFPDSWGATSWNDLEKAQEWTPALDDGCLPSRATTSSPPASVAAARGDRAATLTWSPPATAASAVDRYVVSQEVWGPSVGAWHSMTYRTLPAGHVATTISGLENGRTYRFRVLAHTAAGNSAWTAAVKAIPADVPLAPGTDRRLTAGTSYIRFGWHGSVPRGTPVTAYTVAIRSWRAGGWTAWSFTRIPAAELTHRWDGLRPGTTYQVTARAESGAGPSPWGSLRKVVTLR